MEELFEKWYCEHVQDDATIKMNSKDAMGVVFEAGYKAAVDEQRKQTYHIRNYMENKP